MDLYDLIRTVNNETANIINSIPLDFDAYIVCSDNLRQAAELLNKAQEKPRGTAVPRVRENKYAGYTLPPIKKIIFNEGRKDEDGNELERGATLVFFADGSKVVVRRSKLDVENKEHALLYAIVKRLFGKVDPETGLVNGTANSLLKTLLEKADVQPAKVVTTKKAAARDEKGRFVKKEDK